MSNIIITQFLGHLESGSVMEPPIRFHQEKRSFVESSMEKCFNTNSPQSSKKLPGIKSYTFILTLLWTMCLSNVFANEILPEQKTTISSGCEYDYPPFCIVEENGYANGFSVELLRAALKVMNRDVTFQNGQWFEVKGMLERGEIDVLPLVGRTPERESIFDFTFPYMSLHGVIVVRKGNTNIFDLSDLKGRVVAVMEGDNADEFLRRSDYGLNIQTTATFNDALFELSEGTVDAVVIQRLLALQLIKEAGITNLQIINQTLEGLRQDFCFAVKEGDKEILAIINEGLAIVIANGTFSQLQRKWFASPAIPFGNHIIIGVARGLAPYSFLNENGIAVGYNVDLTNAIANVMHLNIEVKIAPFGELRKALEKGEIDAMPMYYSENRKDMVDFTSPYAMVHNAIFIRKDSPPIKTSYDLHGKKIIVVNGDIMHDWVIDNNITDELVTVSMESEALKLLDSGDFDCALMSQLSGLYWVSQFELDNIVTTGPLMFPSEICFAVKKGNTKLQNILSEGLATIGENGDHMQIRDKWLGVLIPIGVSKSTVFSYILYTAFLIFLIMVLVFIWTRALKRQVNLRTNELRESEDRFRMIIENAPVLINSFDENGKCVLWNNQCKKTFGWTINEINKQDVPLALFYPDPVVCNEVLKSVTSDPDKKFRERHPVTKEGKTLTTMWANFHLPGGQVFSLGHDITERKQAKEQTKLKDDQLRAIMEVSKDFIWLLDKDFNILYANRSGSELKIEDMIGKSIISFLPKDVQTKSRVHLENALECKDFYKYAVDINNADGSITNFENIAIPIKTNGEVIGLTVTSRDITERKKEEVNIAIQQEQLEKLVKERTSELESKNIKITESQSALAYLLGDMNEQSVLLQKTNQQLKMANKEMEAFSYYVSHDLRAPLRAIDGFTRILMEDYVVKLDNEGRRLGSVIQRNARKMGQLIDDLLTFSRSARNPMAISEIDMKNMAHAIYHEATSPEERQRINFSVDEIPYAEGDTTMMRQVWMNLITNAVKFSSKRKESLISISCSEDEDKLIYCIKDNGAGFNMKYKNKLFGVFQRLHSEKEFKGTGVGLALVQRIIHRHGGEIYAESEVDKGATFYFTLKKQLNKTKI